jgi:hypothetical protein
MNIAADQLNRQVRSVHASHLLGIALIRLVPPDS